MKGKDRTLCRNTHHTHVLASTRQPSQHTKLNTFCHTLSYYPLDTRRTQWVVELQKQGSIYGHIACQQSQTPSKGSTQHTGTPSVSWCDVLYVEEHKATHAGHSTLCCSLLHTHGPCITCSDHRVHWGARHTPGAWGKQATLSGIGLCFQDPHTPYKGQECKTRPILMSQCYAQGTNKQLGPNTPKLGSLQRPQTARIQPSLPPPP